MSDAIPAFAATDPDIYERFMGRWSARIAAPFLAFAGVQTGCRRGSVCLMLAAAQAPSCWRSHRWAASRWG